MMSPALARQQALAAARAGDRVAAERLFTQAIARFPQDADLLNSAGNFHAGGGAPLQALACFDRALAVAPRFGEAAINRAVVLTRLGRAREAAASLADGPAGWHTLPRYWTARGAAEIAASDKASAAVSYDQAIAREPRNPRALTGRAQVALDRGEHDAAARFEAVLGLQPGDPHLLLGLLNALDAAGRRDEAIAIAQALAAQLPSWLPGMERLVELRIAAGDDGHAFAHYQAAPSSAHSSDFYLSWATMLAGIGRSDEALAIAEQGLAGFAASVDLAIAAASFRDATGDHAGASAIFHRHRHRGGPWLVHEARHRLRRGDPAAADRLLEQALSGCPDDVAAWSLRDLAWRMMADDRHAWLSLQPGLVRTLDLALGAGELRQAVRTLDALHDRSAPPVGQSVRGGSQTRGALFDLADPIVTRITAAVEDALRVYRAGLPPVDARHPLLRHRDTPWSFAGSWSIRLVGRGRHASHIHPQGVVSSAAYFVVPPAGGDRSGWLELGRPPSDLRCDLPPIATIEPRPGLVALFPSTLYHGTRPITAGRRMTVAFDVEAERPAAA